MPEKCNNVCLVCSDCEYRYFCSYYLLPTKKRKFYEDCLKSEFISFGRNTVYETKFFKIVTADIVHKHASFKSISDSFNSIFTNPHWNRDQLIEVRLVEDWLYWQFLNFVNDNFHIEHYEFPKATDIDSEIKLHRQNFFKLFVNKWTGESHHSYCAHPDCSKILNVDGNWKINRLRCMYEGVTLTSEEVKAILIGCPNTPKRNSYFCEKHTVLEPNLCFKINENPQLFKIKDIKEHSLNGQTISLVKIHDFICIPDDPKSLLYLCEIEKYKTKFIWLKPTNIPIEILREFNDRLVNNQKDQVNTNALTDYLHKYN